MSLPSISRPRRSGHDQCVDAGPPAEANDCYAFLEWQSNEVTRSLVGFTGLITPVPDNLSPAQWESLEARYAAIKEWQSTTLELFSSSLKGLVHRFQNSAPIDQAGRSIL